MTRIKICGLTRLEDIAYVNEARPDYCGFVIDAPRSPRNITPVRARQLAAALDEGVIRVGVFVDAPPKKVAQLLEEGTIQAAQLHGKESPQYISYLRELTDKPLIQAFRIKIRGDVDIAAHSQADYILLDAGSGGGKTFDWRLAKNIKRPFFLAGGLGPDNLREAISQTHPYAVDMSSGVETEGRKDREKILAAGAVAAAE